MKFLIFIYLFITTYIFSQEVEKDPLSPILGLTKETVSFSLKSDWQIFTHPFNTYSLNGYYPLSYSQYSLHELYANYKLNSSLTFTQPDVLLNQFKLSSNLGTKKKYGVFAKYLGMAELFGVMGLAAIHISKFNAPLKGATASNKFNKFIKPKNSKDLHKKEIP